MKHGIRVYLIYSAKLLGKDWSELWEEEKKQLNTMKCEDEPLHW